MKTAEQFDEDKNEKSTGSRDSQDYLNIFERLYIDNDRLCKAEQIDLAKECASVICAVPEAKFTKLSEELSEYDPRDSGIVDSALFAHLLVERIKPVVLQSELIRKLVQFFAVNGKKPRDLRYIEFVDYMRQLLDLTKNRINDHQGPYSKKGDAGLLNELERAMAIGKITKTDLLNMRRNIALAKRHSTGIFVEKQIVDLMRSTNLLVATRQILPKLLNRCELNDDLRYDSDTLLMFLQEAFGRLKLKEDDVLPNVERDKDEHAELDSEKMEKNGFPSKQGMFKKTTSYFSIDQGIGPDTARAEDQARQADARMVQLLLAALKKLDYENNDLVPVFKARIIIQQYNDLHRLGLDSRTINYIMASCSNKSGTMVKLSRLSSAIVKEANAQ